jgi:hypothetical protein
MTVSIDADATFMNLDLPLEWLFNRWNITKTTSLTLPIDPDQPNNKDRAHGQTNLNCGLVIAQNSPRTHEILQAWEDCPDDEDRFPGCDKWKTDWPAEQAAFGEYIRYEFEEEDDVKSIPCDEANGFPGNPFGECNGVFVRHHWSDKDLVKGVVGDEILRVLMGAVHRDFVRDKSVVVDGGREEQEEEELDGDMKEVEEAFPGERFAGEAFAKEAFGRKS